MAGLSYKHTAVCVYTQYSVHIETLQNVILFYFPLPKKYCFGKPYLIFVVLITYTSNNDTHNGYDCIGIILLEISFTRDVYIKTCLFNIMLMVFKILFFNIKMSINDAVCSVCGTFCKMSFVEH